MTSRSDIDRVKFCVHCGDSFVANTAWAKYCSRACEGKQYRRRKGLISDIGRYCKQCGKHFVPPYNENHKLHCSKDCAVKSARESRSRFWNKQPNVKEKKAEYYKKSREKIGPDGNLKRHFSRFPDAPKACQSCGERRVLDVAHKPGFERKGAWRSVKNTKPEMVWILCPTCHALLDRMHYAPSDLGLSV